MDSDTVYEVVKKLVGPIGPVGATHVDGERFDNLQVMTELADKIITAIDDVACVKNAPEHSVNKAGTFASDFLDRLGIEE